jgi:hypothetical protein
VWGSVRVHQRFLGLGTNWRWVVSFTPRPLYPRGKILRYSLDRRLGGLQSRSGRHGEIKILAPTGTRTPTPWSGLLLTIIIVRMLLNSTDTNKHIECSFCRLIRRPGSFLESLIGRQCGSPRQTEGSVITWSVRSCYRSFLYCSLFFVFMARVGYNLEQRIFIYDYYVKTNSY